MKIKVSALSIGDTVSINENGTYVDYIVVQQGNPDENVYDSSCNGTWLMRSVADNNVIMPTDLNYPTNRVASSTEKYYTEYYDDNTKTHIKQIIIPYDKYIGTLQSEDCYLEKGNPCHCFALSQAEITTSYGGAGKQLSYFANGGTAARTYGYWTRSNSYYSNSTGWVYFNNNGVRSYSTNVGNIRNLPVFILDSDTEIFTVSKIIA